MIPRRADKIRYQVIHSQKPQAYRHFSTGTHTHIRLVPPSDEPPKPEPAWLSSALEKIDSLPSAIGRMGEPANEWVLKTAREMVTELCSKGIKPRKIMAVADGGICFTFELDGKHARIEIENDGVVVVKSGAEAMANCEDVPPKKAVPLLASYLAA